MKSDKRAVDVDKAVRRFFLSLPALDCILRHHRGRQGRPGRLVRSSCAQESLTVDVVLTNDVLDEFLKVTLPDADDTARVLFKERVIKELSRRLGIEVSIDSLPLKLRVSIKNLPFNNNENQP
jgi:hypothetical protein